MDRAGDERPDRPPTLRRRRGCPQSTALITTTTSVHHLLVEKGCPVKFRCERDVLAEALATAGRAATGRTGTLPVLSGLRLELAGDTLTVTGTDLELTIQLEVPVGGERDGGVVLPARLVGRHRRVRSAGKVEVRRRRRRRHDQRRPVAVRRASVVARRLPAQHRARRRARSRCRAPSVGEALRQVVRAASTDEARPILTGVLLAAEDDGLRMVATDSYRLAVRDLPGAACSAPTRRCSSRAARSTELQRPAGLRPSSPLRLGEREADVRGRHDPPDHPADRGRVPELPPADPREYPNTLTVGTRCAARGDPTGEDPRPGRTPSGCR